MTKIRFHPPQGVFNLVESLGGFIGGSVVKHPPANEGNAGDTSSLPDRKDPLE